MGDWVDQLHYTREGLDEEAMIKYLGWTPLHVAASRGVISETVRALMEVRPDMCLARDRDGANPLHVAAMGGKIEVLDELYNANPHAARARVGSAERESILHLCVKYNQQLFLSKLLEKYKGREFVNAKDSDGNTILHLAVADRRLQFVELVIRHTKIDVNAVNASNQTAMDIYLDGREKGSIPGTEDMYIEALLQTKDARKEVSLLIDPARLAERRNAIMVAAVLVATLAFQVGVNPPGGVWPPDTDGHGHRSGEALMASTYPYAYKGFLFGVIFCFSTSILTVVLILLDMVRPTRIFWSLTLCSMFTTVVFLVATFATSLQMVSPAGPKPPNNSKPRGPLSRKFDIFLILTAVLMVLCTIWWPIILWMETRERMIKAEKRIERLNRQHNQALDQRRGHPNEALVDVDNNA